jgi:hypothetical protein
MSFPLIQSSSSRGFRPHPHCSDLYLPKTTLVNEGYEIMDYANPDSIKKVDVHCAYIA